MVIVTAGWVIETLLLLVAVVTVLVVGIPWVTVTVTAGRVTETVLMMVATAMVVVRGPSG